MGYSYKQDDWSQILECLPKPLADDVRRDLVETLNEIATAFITSRALVPCPPSAISGRLRTVLSRPNCAKSYLEKDPIGRAAFWALQRACAGVRYEVLHRIDDLGCLTITQ